MGNIALEEYKQLVQEQGQALLDIVQSVALGDLDREIEVPEGIEILSDLAVGMEMMVDDIRDMMAALEREAVERERLHAQEEVIEAQKQAIQELSTPVIPVMERIIIMPLVGSIDSERARDITRGLLAGIQEHRAKIVILDITGVSIVDSEVANHLNKTIQAARLKGAQSIVTGISDAVAETIVDLGIDWSNVDTLGNLQTGLRVALGSLGIKLARV